MSLPKNQTDPLYQIIEAAYHCAHTWEQMHAAIAKAGLEQVSDETLMMLLGEYSDSLED